MDDLTTATPDATLPAYENPLGVDGFEFGEFTGPDPQGMIRQIEVMGFVQTHVNPRNGVVRMKQGDITFLVHTKPEGHAGGADQRPQEGAHREEAAAAPGPDGERGHDRRQEPHDDRDAGPAHQRDRHRTLRSCHCSGWTVSPRPHIGASGVAAGRGGA